MTRIIDIHTHVFPVELAPKAVEALNQPGRHEPHYDATLAGLLAKMDEAGIEVSVTQPVATRPSQVRSINDWAATTASDRIVPFGAVHPDLDDPAGELRHIASLGMRGFKMHADYQDCAPDDPRMQPIMETARDLGLIAFMHAGADVGPQSVLGSPEAFARMLDRYPGTTVVLAHLGGFQCWEGVRDLLVGRDVWLDTAYTLTHLPDDEFVSMVRAHGIERVLFGTDGPWTNATRELAHLRELGFSATELDAMLHRNAERLLGMTTS